MSQPRSYYNTGDGIAINKALCVGGLTESSVSSGVFHCKLNNVNTTARVSVHPGDILGLELPGWPGRLAFAEVSRGPTNYMFDFTRQSPSSNSLFSAALSSSSWMSRNLPQIALEIGSGKFIILAIIL